LPLNSNTFENRAGFSFVGNENIFVGNENIDVFPG